MYPVDPKQPLPSLHPLTPPATPDFDSLPLPTSRPREAPHARRVLLARPSHLSLIANFAGSSGVTKIDHVENLHYSTADVLRDLPKQKDISGHQSEYLPGSRESDLEGMQEWAKKPSPELVLGVHAAAGLGKSTLARELAHRLRSSDRLAAFVSLNAIPNDARGPESVVKVIAREIAEIHPGAVPLIARAIGECKSSPLEDHIVKFIGESVRSLGMLSSPLVVILDASDEWEYTDTLVKKLACLIPFSSSADGISRTRGHKDAFIQPYQLQPVSPAVMGRYFEMRFDDVEWDYGRRPSAKNRSERASCILGQQKILKQSIYMLRWGFSLQSPGHPLRPSSLGNLANCLQSLFQTTGSLGDLQEAIRLQKEALSLHPPGHPVPLRTAGSLDDLHEAIRLHKEALSFRPPGHPDRSASLNNLANSLFQTSTGSLDDLHEAIRLHKEALSVRPPGHPLRPPSLGNLANCLQSLFRTAGSLDDLHEAIRLHKEALSLRPPPSLSLFFLT
ncbi:hypothetical protein FA13DRAFT_1721959 [Coprinellus micaceus]|uniref:Nephrocystin 3-like N-terminal domain-containing protein n=1 Tax=Coprinellus micaceus TaxID=71717 RepID=A0A4Y7RVI0_COPMI|nr:hypothetical protein FA13DRAFT_1721959 [Coprinellus micaceus]